tara:strand:- start:40 stop:156 length:117 start_codon:yes stop_codon:yes gene_type:complete
MLKLTEEILNKIKESGVPVVDITLDDLESAEVVKLKQE